jgi:hypothetical protein
MRFREAKSLAWHIEMPGLGLEPRANEHSRTLDIPLKCSCPRHKCLLEVCLHLDKPTLVLCRVACTGCSVDCFVLSLSWRISFGFQFLGFRKMCLSRKAHRMPHLENYLMCTRNVMEARNIL